MVLSDSFPTISSRGGEHVRLVQFWPDHFFGIAVTCHASVHCTYVQRAHMWSFSSHSCLSWHLAVAAAEMTRRSPRFLMLTIDNSHTTFTSERSGRRTLYTGHATLSGSHLCHGSTMRRTRILCCAMCVLSTLRVRWSRKLQSSGSEARRCYESPFRQTRWKIFFCTLIPLQVQHTFSVITDGFRVLHYKTKQYNNCLCNVQV